MKGWGMLVQQQDWHLVTDSTDLYSHWDRFLYFLAGSAGVVLPVILGLTFLFVVCLLADRYLGPDIEDDEDGKAGE